MYYNVWESPPSHATRFLFMEQVLIPRLDHDSMIQSAHLRGLELERITKMDLMLLLGECFELEVEIKGHEGHLAFQASEEQIKVRWGSPHFLFFCSGREVELKDSWHAGDTQTYSLDKHSKLLQPVK